MQAQRTFDGSEGETLMQLMLDCPWAWTRQCLPSTSSPSSSSSSAPSSSSAALSSAGASGSQMPSWPVLSPTNTSVFAGSGWTAIEKTRSDVTLAYRATCMCLNAWRSSATSFEAASAVGGLPSAAERDVLARADESAVRSASGIGSGRLSSEYGPCVARRLASRIARRSLSSASCLTRSVSESAWTPCRRADDRRAGIVDASFAFLGSALRLGAEVGAGRLAGMPRADVDGSRPSSLSRASLAAMLAWRWRSLVGWGVGGGGARRREASRRGAADRSALGA